MSSAVINPWETPPTGPAQTLAGRTGDLVPRIETTRLTLRAPMIGDFASYADILMSDRAIPLDGPFDRQAAWHDFCQYAAGWLLRGAGMWTITLRETGEVLGFVSAGMEFGDHEHELGYLLTEAAEGHGYATEAAEAVRDTAVDVLRLPSLVSYVDPGNDRSVAMAERIGARRDTVAEARFDEPVLVYRHHPGVLQ